MTGRKLLDLVEDRGRRGNVEETQVGIHRREVNGRPNVRVHQQGLQLRGEEQHAAGAVSVKERLLAQPIASQQELPPAVIPHGEGEHAAQVVEEPGALLLVEVHDHLCVRPRPKAVPPALELGAQFDEVVDLAVQDNPYRAVFIRDGLLAGREIDDRQTPARQADRPGHVMPRVVRPAV